MSATVYLHGIADRAARAEQPLGPGVAVPATVPFTLEFNPREVIGTASLRRTADGDIWAEATVQVDDSTLFGHAMLHAENPWPYLAIMIKGTTVTKEDGLPMGRITAGGVCQAAVVARSSDPDLPQYKAVVTRDD